MPKTYEPIASTTLTAGTASVTFSSIPQTYTDLVLVVQGDTTLGDDLRIRLNSDTGSNYSYTVLGGNGSSVAAQRGINLTSFYGSYYGNFSTTLGDSFQTAHFLNYSNTTTKKTTLIRSNKASGGTDVIVGLYRSNSAISTILLFPNSGSFESGSTFVLYGIKAA